MQKLCNSIYRGWIAFYCECCGKREYSYQNLGAIKICECGTKQENLFTLDIEEWIAEDFVEICRRDLEKEQHGNHIVFLDEVFVGMRKSIQGEMSLNNMAKILVEAIYELMENLRLNFYG